MGHGGDDQQGSRAFAPGRLLVGLAVAVVALAPVLVASPASAAGVINVTATTVEVGGSFEVRGTGCTGGSDSTYRFEDYWIVTGTGAAAVVAADRGVPTSNDREQMTIPGWVDPDQPAFVAARCMEQRQGFVDGRYVVTTTTLFTYPEVPIDITAPPAPVPTMTATVSRSDANQGQELTITGSGCAPGRFATVSVLLSGDPTGRGGLSTVAGDLAQPDANGNFSIQLTLNGYDARQQIQRVDTSIPVPIGRHALIYQCISDSGGGPSSTARPEVIDVTGTNPTASHRFVFNRDDTVTIEGAGCTGGRVVTLDLDGHVTPGGFITETHDITPATDGSWSFTVDEAASGVQLDSSARCGDPQTTGFAYIRRLTDDGGMQTAVTAVDPAEVDPGQAFTVDVTGSCSDELVVEAELGDRFEAISTPFLLYSGTVEVEVTAPSTPGTYTLIVPCRHAEAETATVVVRASQSSDPTDAAAPPAAAPAASVPGTPSYTG